MDGSQFYRGPKPTRWWQRRLPLGQGLLLVLAIAATLFALGLRLEGAAP